VQIRTHEAGITNIPTIETGRQILLEAVIEADGEQRVAGLG
jgi:hypothetical protein